MKHRLPDVTNIECKGVFSALECSFIFQAGSTSQKMNKQVMASFYQEQNKRSYHV